MFQYIVCQMQYAKNNRTRLHQVAFGSMQTSMLFWLFWPIIFFATEICHIFCKSKQSWACTDIDSSRAYCSSSTDYIRAAAVCTTSKKEFMIQNGGQVKWKVGRTWVLVSRCIPHDMYHPAKHGLTKYNPNESHTFCFVVLYIFWAFCLYLMW